MKRALLHVLVIGGLALPAGFEFAWGEQDARSGA
jgi:hypothetical protein